MTPPATFTGPALFDIQVNGYAGFDFNSDPASWQAEDFVRVKDALARRGVLRSLPTLITDDVSAMARRAERYRELVEAEPTLATAFPRLHIEGPFVSAEDGPRGAHPSRYCAVPAQHPGWLDRMSDAAGGRIGIVTLAPELDGALALVEVACGNGICVAIGHTAASTAELLAAIDAGAQLSTHLGNGSHQLLPRLDNYVQTQLGEDRLCASFIADGHHIPFGTLKNFIRAKEAKRCILVTDAIAGADAGPGRYQVGQQEIVVSTDLRAFQPGVPGLAGSATTLDRAILNVATHCDCTFERAWAMASHHPAELLQLDPLPEISVAVRHGGFSLMTPALHRIQ